MDLHLGKRNSVLMIAVHKENLFSRGLLVFSEYSHTSLTLFNKRALRMQSQILCVPLQVVINYAIEFHQWFHHCA